MSATPEQGAMANVLDPVPSSLDAIAQVGLRERVRYLCSACRQVFGMPDYERYLTHAAARHPDLPVMTRGDFFRQAIERKYGQGGARCC